MGENIKGRKEDRSLKGGRRDGEFESKG